MIIKKDVNNKDNTIYRCDKCKRETTRKDNYGIFIKEAENKQPKKKWDLCEKCYKSLEKGVEK